MSAMSAAPIPSHATPPAHPLTRDIGQTERALRSLLERQLAPAGLSFPAWTVLVGLDGAGPLTHEALVQRQVDGHIVPTTAAAAATVDHLLAAGLLAHADPPAAPVATPTGAPAERAHHPLVCTPAGDAVYRPVRDAVARVVRALYADLPAGDLEATRRTLAEVARRAHVLLAPDSEAAPRRPAGAAASHKAS